MYPAIGTSPNSIAVLYSKMGVKDSVIFRSSSDGGLTLNNRQVVATTSNYFHRVSLNYGYSETFNTGRYFASWEEKDNSYADFGHIYTAHSQPDFNSPFTDPFCLDSLDNSLINQCRRPLIACQYGEYDNASANITSTIIFETTNSVNQSFDVLGYYNVQAATSDFFQPLTIAGTTDEELYPDIQFNSFDSTFVVTYFDSTNQKLPYLSNEVNLMNPDLWDVVSAGYNDQPVISAPFPKVIIHPIEGSGANVWIDMVPGENGTAMFDALYSTYTGNPEEEIQYDIMDLRIYPNPCHSILTVEFELIKREQIVIDLYDLNGKTVKNLTNLIYSSGNHRISSDLSHIPAGSYFLFCRSNGFHAYKKIIIIRY